MFEDTALYFDASLGMGEGVLLAGQPVDGIFEASSVVEQSEVITVAPTFLTLAAGSAAAEGQILSRTGSSYKVRQVLQEPPDGAMLRLLLVRV
jgi:hypothetical protein